MEMHDSVFELWRAEGQEREKTEGFKRALSMVSDERENGSAGEGGSVGVIMLTLPHATV